jgi:hypothetical protein
MFPFVSTPAGLTHFRSEARKVVKLSRRLARRIFRKMLRHGPKLEREQLVLGHLADAGAELYVASAVIARAESMIDQAKDEGEKKRILTLARYTCRLSFDACIDHLRDSGSRTEKMARKVSGLGAL